MGNRILKYQGKIYNLNLDSPTSIQAIYSLGYVREYFKKEKLSELGDTSHR